jgi:hypothetical protein
VEIHQADPAGVFIEHRSADVIHTQNPSVNSKTIEVVVAPT